MSERYCKVQYECTPYKPPASMGSLPFSPAPSLWLTHLAGNGTLSWSWRQSSPIENKVLQPYRASRTFVQYLVESKRKSLPVNFFAT